MTAKEYLMRAFRLKQKIKAMQEDILRLEAAATDCSPNLTGMPHNPSPSHSRMADIVCKIIDRKAELQKKLDEMSTFLMETEMLLTLVENNEYKTIIKMRYLDGAEWSEIIDELQYAPCHVYRLHNAALNAFEKILKDESK